MFTYWHCNDLWSTNIVPEAAILHKQVCGGNSEIVALCLIISAKENNVFILHILYSIVEFENESNLKLDNLNNRITQTDALLLHALKMFNDIEKKDNDKWRATRKFEGF